MALRDELGLRAPFHAPAHEALLGLYHTASQIKKRIDVFLRAHGITDVQLNLLLLLHYQAGRDGGLTQVELSRMMLVNRANITSLIDRMERSGLVARVGRPGDRRCRVIELTPGGRRLIAKVERDYAREVARIMAPLPARDLASLIRMLDALRGGLRTRRRR
ncbi:MAG: MarR family transcriptional regulator [Candidatus Sumerlaeia bacterium]|nr:MarR family transcriptional regulator [Candidatus Sumerlaeia bacterium]